MAFECPDCAAAGALRITGRLELPADSRSDEITLQTVGCRRCGFDGIAVYEESRRGVLGDESVDHTGYRVGREDLLALRSAMRGCPAPGDPRCGCDAHQEYGRRDRGGRWAGLAGMTVAGTFPMRM